MKQYAKSMMLMTCGVWTACSGLPEEEFAETAEPLATTCDTFEYEEDGQRYTKREFYVFDVMNRDLDESSALRAHVGLDSVESCPNARLFSERLATFQPNVIETPQLDDLSSYPIEAGLETGDPAIGQTQGGIATGISSDFAPSVRLRIRFGSGYTQATGCTGFIIGPREIVTAAHCIYASGRRPVMVTVRHNGSNVCVANCSDSTTTNASGFRHPDYSGVGDAGDDVGVFVLDNNLPFPANSTSDRIRMMTSKTWKNAPLKIFGWGTNKHSGGTSLSREGDVVVSWTGTKHFTANATLSRGCKGDSGGPAVRWTTSDFPLTAGILSEMAGSISANCPYPAGFNRWTHVGPKVSWIEGRIGRTCNRYRSSSNSAITYARCW